MPSRSRYRMLAVVVAFLALPGFKLAGVGDGYDVARIRDIQATGDPFARALTAEYRRIAIFEAEEMVDWADAGHFARKGLQSAAGASVDPEPVEAWSLPEDRLGELTAARQSLMAHYGNGARTKVPKLAARAQGQFDCWIEQQEENHQPDHIAACRTGFYSALEAMKVAMTPKPQDTATTEPEAKVEPPAAPRTYVVYFNFDRARLKPSGVETIAAVAETARRLDPAGVSVTGHADRAGPPDYNIGLSLRRAEAVRDHLLERGFGADDISLAGRGEAETAVPTADGVREQANRRVEIILTD